MPRRTSYPPGTPCWVDLGSPDPAAAAEFYGALLGWSVEFDARPEAGGYGQFTLRGERVAGIGPQTSPEMPPFWAVYFATADVDATAEAVTAAGGQVIAGPMDVFTAGRLAVFADTNGTFVSAWQAIDHQGCGLVNEPGTFVWNELATPDPQRSADFYSAAFGLDADTGERGGVNLSVDGRMVCGAHPASEGEFPAWSVWFAVEDCEASAATAAERGGTVLMPPSDMGFGIGAMVADPHGAVFGICTVNEPAD